MEKEISIGEWKQIKRCENKDEAIGRIGEQQFRWQLKSILKCVLGYYG
jgi:hypothetical protein